MENRQQNRKRTGLLVALALCCILAVGGGVMAWFSAKDEVSNVFTSGGGITDPDHRPEVDPDPDPEKPVNPNPSPDPGDEIKPGDSDHLKGKIIETKWNPNSVITADSVVSKNPNVGIGKDSKDAYVFAEVENNLGEGTYFILNKGWLPVEATQYDGAKGWFVAHDSKLQGAAYTSGLFVYVGDSKDQTPTEAMSLLSPQALGTTGAYTGELFSKVYAGGTASIDGTPTMDVKAYLVAKSNDNDDIASADAKKEIVEAAKAWAEKN